MHIKYVTSGNISKAAWTKELCWEIKKKGNSWSLRCRNLEIIPVIIILHVIQSNVPRAHQDAAPKLKHLYLTTNSFQSLRVHILPVKPSRAAKSRLSLRCLVKTFSCFFFFFLSLCHFWNHWVETNKELTRQWFSHPQLFCQISEIQTTLNLNKKSICFCCSRISKCSQTSTRWTLNVCLDVRLTDSVMYICTPSAYCRA